MKTVTSESGRLFLKEGAPVVPTNFTYVEFEYFNFIVNIFRENVWCFKMAASALVALCYCV